MERLSVVRARGAFRATECKTYRSYWRNDDMPSRIIGAAAVAAVVAFSAPLAAQSPATSTHPPYPWADQKLPPIVLHKHGVFWAGGQIVKRTQVGTEASGPVTVPIATQDYEVGQAYV